MSLALLRDDARNGCVHVRRRQKHRRLAGPAPLSVLTFADRCRNRTSGRGLTDLGADLWQH